MSELQKVLGGLFGDGLSGGYSYSEDLADGITSDPVYIRSTGRGNSHLSVSMICGSNTGKIQTTISSLAKIEAGTATWIDWDKGSVTGTQIDVLVALVSAIRGVSVSGSVSFEILV